MNINRQPAIMTAIYNFCNKHIKLAGSYQVTNPDRSKYLSKKNQQYCYHETLNLSFSRVYRHLWTVLYTVVLISWGFHVFSISIVSAQNNSSRVELTELLFRAVKNNDINAARAAIKAGAELSRINLNGETAMDIAINNNHFKIANYLVFARRIEQQVTKSLAPTINSIQQESPEAAPVVEILTDKSPSSQQTKEKNIILSSKDKVEKPSTAKQSAIKRIKVTKNKVDNQDKSVTKTPQIESSIPQSKSSNTRQKIQKETSNKPEKNIAEKKLNSSETIFFMDANGNLLTSSASEIRKIQKILRQKASRLLPDIEPRKSLFIPRPRLKPSVLPPKILQKSRARPKKSPKLKRKISPINQNNLEPELSKSSLPDLIALPSSQKVQNKAVKLPNVTPKNQKPTLTKSNTSNVKKPSRSQKVKSKAAEIEYIRPTRRISPELLNKLRRGLEKTKRQQRVSPRITKNHAEQKINSSKVNQEKPKDQVETSSFPAPDTSREEKSAVPPEFLLEDKTTIEKHKSKEQNIFGRIYTNLTNLLSVGSEPQKATKKIEPQINQAKNTRLLEKTLSSEKNTTKIKTVNPHARNHSEPQLSRPPEPTEQDQISLKSTNSGKIRAGSNRWLDQLHPGPRQFLKQQIKEKEITPRRVDSFVKFKSLANFNSKDRQSKRVKIQTTVDNSASAQQPNASMPLTRLRKPLKNISLALGKSITTGQSKLPHGIAEPDPCIQKRRGKISFCIVPIDWPQGIENAFIINTSLYQGTRAIARYDRGKATHFHVLFKSVDHNKIINFIKRQYGPPTGTWKRTIAPFGKPRQPNPTFVWRSHDINKNEVTILEVRKFDDTRAVFPDTKHGAIRLYIAGGPPVFPIVTAHDIMSIDWAARSDHLEDGFPSLAKTIRVQP